MRLKKIGATVVAISLMIGGSATNGVYAMQLQDQTLINVNHQIITPFWNSISDISPYISVEGNTLYPEVYIEAKSSSGSISGTMYLEKFSGGKWTSVASWRFTGTSNVFLSKSYIGISGVNYRTKVVVTIDGETATATSGSCEI